LTYRLSGNDLFLFDFFDDDFFPTSAGLFLASLAAFHRANWTWCSRSISLSVIVNRTHCTEQFLQNAAKLHHTSVIGNAIP